jgi:hypothetical protein
MPIGDRIKEAIDKMQQRDNVNSLIQVSIAIDATAKKIYPKLKTSERCKAFIRDNQAFITRTAFGLLEIQGPFELEFNGQDGKTHTKTFEEVLYHLVRCSLIHEGDLPNEVEFTDSKSIGVTNGGKILISTNIIMALIMSVIASEPNAREKLPICYTATIDNRNLILNDFWGKKEELYKITYEVNVK